MDITCLVSYDDIPYVKRHGLSILIVYQTSGCANFICNPLVAPSPLELTGSESYRRPPLEAVQDLHCAVSAIATRLGSTSPTTAAAASGDPGVNFSPNFRLILIAAHDLAAKLFGMGNEASTATGGAHKPEKEGKPPVEGGATDNTPPVAHRVQAERVCRLFTADLLKEINGREKGDGGGAGKEKLGPEASGRGTAVVALIGLEEARRVCLGLLSGGFPFGDLQVLHASVVAALSGASCLIRRSRKFVI